MIRTPDHVQAARRLQIELTAETGIHTWHIVHNKDESILLCGYYRAYDSHSDLQDYTRAQLDRRLIAGLLDKAGNRRFPLVIFVPIDRPDPPAPAEWNLANAPAAAYWSLQIAAYRGSDRKQLAVDAVREARGAGAQAYYYHGETISSICIGIWPETAVKRQASSAASTRDPTATLFVPSEPLPLRLTPLMRDRDGTELTTIAPRLEILDPTLAKAIADYPQHAINGEVMVKTLRSGQHLASPSFLVLVPHADKSAPQRLSPLEVPMGK
ncbi:MAG TPA: hypothetical protein VFE47_31845 [Tepidisphaeraceae bacterium]|nr:hypothetical protein [Tepidisphaeraceae bacterium]